MDDTRHSFNKKEFVTVWVRDPRLHKEDFWHTHIDYEICLYTNSMCFRKKTSCVRRRYSEFVWLRQKLQENALLINLFQRRFREFSNRYIQPACNYISPRPTHPFTSIHLQDHISQVPKLPPANLFFSFNNTMQVNQRMEGLKKFLKEALHLPLLLSDSHLHLFLQSQLSISKIEACVQGRTRYTVAEAIQCGVCDTRFPLEDESKSFSDSESSSTVLAYRVNSVTPKEMSSQDGSYVPEVLNMESKPECLPTSSDTQQDLHL